MSHQTELEKGAYRFSVPAGDVRFRHFTSREVVVLALRTHANNVEPPDPCWDMVGVTQRQVCYDRELLPNELWTLAGAADGGMIKPNGRTCTGTAYVKQWRDALEGCLDGLVHCPLRRVHLRAASGDESFPLPPLSLGEVHDLPADSVRWGKWTQERAGLRTAFHALAPAKPETPGGLDLWTNPGAVNFWHALYLYINRRHLPFSVHFSG